MNENELKNERQKYLDEMMALYSMNNTENTPETTEEPPSVPQEFDVPEIQTENTQEDITDEEINEPDITERMPDTSPPQPNPQTVDKRFPPPVLPDFIRPSQTTMPSPPPPPPRPPMPQRPVNVPPRPMPAPPEILPQPKPSESNYGFLKVNVRTGDNGLPVPDASVTVSRKINNGEELIFTGVTNESGATDRIKLPAPPNTKGNTPASFGNYAVYDVTVFSKDFYRQTSKNVPVFSGITSLQQFNLIPKPFNYDDNGRSIVTNNTEPTF